MNETKHVQAQRVGAFFKRYGAAIAVVGIGVAVLVGMTVFLRPVTIDDNGKQLTVMTFGRDRGTILAGAGVAIQPLDIVTDTLDGDQPAIYIDRAMDIHVEIDGKRKTMRLQDGTVADALKAANVLLDTHELVELVPADSLTDNLVVRLRELAYQTRTEATVIAHESALTYTTEVKPGSRVVSTAGVDGEAQRVYRDYYKDGKLVATVLVSETITKEPVTEVAQMGLGSRSRSPVPLELDENGRPLQYKEVLTGDACAYYFKRGTGTATGTKCHNGVVAVNPDIIPYGTKMFIIADDGYVYGYAEARDTGIAVRENLIIADLFMETYPQTCRFGRRHVSIYILE